MNYETPLTDPISITNGLSLTPRIKLLLTVFRADAAVASLDEWKFKRALFDFLNSSFSLPITVADDDLLLRRVKDVKNRKRDDPVATGSLLVRDLGFVKDSAAKVRDVGGDGNDVVGLLEREFREWRKELVGKMDGMEVSLEGVKFRVWVRVPVSDDFELMKKEWEEYYVLGISRRGYQRGGRQEPDTIILRGVPSRWFAEPRVSSKPSMLVTHTIFSTFGKIRNLNVAEDDYLGKDTDNDTEDIVSGLQCKIVVQFEKHRDFYNTLKVLCGRSLQKEGSRLRADYEVTWDKDGFFEDARRRTQEMSSRVSALASLSYRHEGPRRLSYTSRYSPDNARAKRLKE